jgi:hypothetical protein
MKGLQRKMATRKKPVRTTCDLGVWARPEVRDRAEDDARRFGLTRSQYVSNLILETVPEEEAAAGAAVLGEACAHLVRTLAELHVKQDVDLTRLEAELMAIRSTLD